MRRSSLLREQSGAIMVMGLFMAVALISILYYVVGLGDTILFRERMQDASDAGAYSAAIVHARGMNIIVMINILMAAVLAILVVLKLISATCILAIGICLGLSWVSFGAAAAAIPGLESARQTSDQLFNGLKTPVFQFLRGARGIAVLVKNGIPVAAQAEVFHLTTHSYGQRVDASMVIPVFASLPVEEDAFDRLCEKAGEYAGEMIVFPIRNILPGWIADKLAGGLAGTAKSFSSYFCGKSGGAPPELSTKIDEYLPPVDSQESNRCRDSQNTGSKDRDCQIAEQQAKDVRDAIDTVDGSCRGVHREMCERQKATARAVCKPGTRPNLQTWWWQQQKISRVFTLVTEPGKRARVVQIGDDRIVESKYIGGSEGRSRPPCDGGVFSQAWTEWSAAPEGFVCTSGTTEPNAFLMQSNGHRETTVTFDVVSDVIGCMAQTEKKIVLSEKLVGAKDDGSMSPQKVLDCAQLGDPNFQLKTITHAKSGGVAKYLPGVELASWGNTANSGAGVLETFAENARRFSVAQAEYYFSLPGASRDEWMWTMAWRARLKRVRMNGGVNRCDTKDISGKTVPSILGNIDKLILH